MVNYILSSVFLEPISFFIQHKKFSWQHRSDPEQRVRLIPRSLTWQSKYCEYADEYHFNTLYPSSDWYRHGSLLCSKNQNQVLGSMKYLGDNTFLSWVDLPLQRGFALQKGGIYGIDIKLAHQLDVTYSKTNKGSWDVVSVDTLPIFPSRMLKTHWIDKKTASLFPLLIDRELALYHGEKPTLEQDEALSNLYMRCLYSSRTHSS